MPPGSLPGIASLAIAPTMRPTINVIKMCMTGTPGLGGLERARASRTSTSVAAESTGNAANQRLHPIDQGVALGHELVERAPRRLRSAPGLGLRAMRGAGRSLHVGLGVARPRLDLAACDKLANMPLGAARRDPIAFSWVSILGRLVELHVRERQHAACH